MKFVSLMTLGLLILGTKTIQAETECKKPQREVSCRKIKKAKRESFCWKGKTSKRLIKKKCLQSDEIVVKE